MIKIIGAGMAGLLAANMLRHHDPVVIEAQEVLPNNHSAVLRFRSHVVGDVLGIQFKKVRMVKAPVPYLNPIADALLYSKKNSGVSRSDRSITDGLVIQERFIAPSDLIQRMAARVEVRLGQDFNFMEETTKVISTIPMPALVRALGYPREISFGYSGGVNIRAVVPDCDAYVSLMVPDPDLLFSRISLTGDELIVEVPNQLAMGGHRELIADFPVVKILREACLLLGIDGVRDIEVHNQRYSKILPIDEDERRNFIHWASSITGKAWQLGRFATWRPGLLLDDLVKDVRIIDRWISSPTAGYEQDMLRGREQ